MKDYCNDCGTVESFCICNEPQFYETKKRKIRKQLVEVRKVRRSDAELPDNIKVAFTVLNRQEKMVYSKRLYNLGWTYQNIGNACGVTREAVRKWVAVADADRPDVNFEKVYSLPVKEKPVRFVKVFKHIPLVPSTDIVTQLKELHNKARLIRGPGVLYRSEAEQFSAMLNDLINQGYSSYQISKALGLTHGALNHRLVRYGYKQTNGKSKAYQLIKHRQLLEDING